MSRREWGPLKPIVETPEGIGHTLPEGPVALARELRTGGLDRDDGTPPKVRTIETINTSNNRLDLARCDRLGIYLIRFDRNPNAGRAKDEPHPVLELLRRGGYHYKPLPEGGMAWQKPYTAGKFNARDEVDARRLVRDAAKALGAQLGHDVLL